MLQEITENQDYTNGVAVEVKPSAEGLLSKAVIVSFKTGRFGNTKRVSKGEIEITFNGEQVDRDALKTNKELLDSKELQAIGSFDAKTRVKLLTYCLPSYVDDGYYFLPISLIETVNDYLARRQTERSYLVNDFLAIYPAKRDSARLRLGPLFRSTDYPSEDAVRRTFTWTVRYISFSVPSSLSEISADLFREETRKQEEMWESAAREVEIGLTEALAGLVERAIEKLSFQVNGKPQVFRDSMVENFNEFLDLFDQRNLTSNASLTALAGQARQLMAGVDPSTLRSNLGARERIRAGFVGIQQTMDAMLVDRPVRAIDLED